MDRVAIYIPLLNGAEWCQSVELPPGVQIIAADNGSTDGADKVLESRGALVIRHERPLGRLGNWEFCLNHFRTSGADWMKFLFVGDKVSAQFVEELGRAHQAHPGVNLFLFGYRSESAEGPSEYFPAGGERLVPQREKLERTVTDGPWIGGFVNMVIGRAALEEPVQFPPFDWAGDFYVGLKLVLAAEVAQVPRVIGTFVAKQRQHFQKLHGTLQMHLEELWIRDYALRQLEEERAPGLDSLRAALYIDACRRLLGATNRGDALSAENGRSEPGQLLAELLSGSVLRAEVVKRALGKLGWRKP